MKKYNLILFLAVLTLNTMTLDAQIMNATQ